MLDSKVEVFESKVDVSVADAVDVSDPVDVAVDVDVVDDTVSRQMLCNTQSESKLHQKHKRNQAAGVGSPHVRHTPLHGTMTQFISCFLFLIASCYY